MKNWIVLLFFTIASLSSFAASNRVLDADQIDGQKQSRNYLKTFDAEKNVRGWVCSGGGSQSVTRTATTPLAGLGSFIFTLPAVNDACYFPFTIASGDLATVLRTTFKYLPITTVGTYADGEFEIDILDGSGVAIESKIQPSQIFGNSLPTNQPYGEWQTQPANLSYRFVIKRVVASSTSTLKMDSLFIGQASKISGPIVTDWKAYTPTLGNFGNATAKAKYKRIGDSLNGIVLVTIGSSLPTGIISVSLPNGLSIDGSKYPSGGTTNELTGIAKAGTNTSAVVYSGVTQFNNLTTIGAYGSTNTSFWSNTVPYTLATGDYVEFEFTVPIVGWSSNQVLSEDAGSRIISSMYTNPTGTVNSSYNIVKYNNLVSDTTESCSVSTGICTIQETGYYDIGASFRLSATYALNNATYLKIYIDGVDSGYFDVIAPAAGVNFVTPKVNISALPLRKGQTVSVYSLSFASAFIYGEGFFSIAKRSSPQQIAASETVNARAYLSSNQTGVNPNASTVKINLNATSFDSHAAVNTSTYKYVCPSSGKFSVDASVWIAATNVLNSGYALAIAYDGSVVNYGPYTTPAASTQFAVPTKDTINCISGHYVELFLYGVGNNSSNTLTILGSNLYSYFVISKIGN